MVSHPMLLILYNHPAHVFSHKLHNRSLFKKKTVVIRYEWIVVIIEKWWSFDNNLFQSAIDVADSIYIIPGIRP